MKLQESYAMENNFLGSWENIGYKSPAGNASGDGSTTNFKYTAPTVEDSAKTIDAGFLASNAVALNDCKISTGSWSVKSEFDEQSGNVTATASVSGTGCEELTPSFDKISIKATSKTGNKHNCFIQKFYKRSPLRGPFSF